MASNTVRTEDTLEKRKTSSVARYLPAVARVLMGLLFLVTGLNGFVNFLPQPSPGQLSEAAIGFHTALMATGYMFQLIAGTQLLVGVLLLTNRFVPLALALIAPVVVNILGFHVFLEPSGLGLALVVLALEVYLTWAYRRAFLPMLVMRARPD